MFCRESSGCSLTRTTHLTSPSSTMQKQLRTCIQSMRPPPPSPGSRQDRTPPKVLCPCLIGPEPGLSFSERRYGSLVMLKWLLVWSWLFYPDQMMCITWPTPDRLTDISMLLTDEVSNQNVGTFMSSVKIVVSFQMHLWVILQNAVWTANMMFSSVTSLTLYFITSSLHLQLSETHVNAWTELYSGPQVSNQMQKAQHIIIWCYSI